MKNGMAYKVIEEKINTKIRIILWVNKIDKQIRCCFNDFILTFKIHWIYYLMFKTTNTYLSFTFNGFK
jgi:hypothetical protein